MREIDAETLMEKFGTTEAAGIDGAFIGACTTTHIYCRPLCPAGVHVSHANVRTFSSPAQAERAGFRPCLTCCPDGMPSPSEELGFSAAAVAFDQAVRENIAQPDDSEVAALACKAAKLSPAEGEQMTLDQFGASPVDYVRTTRRLTAKRLMRESVADLDEVAAACGFANGEALAAEFTQAYKLDAHKLAAQRPRKPSLTHVAS